MVGGVVGVEGDVGEDEEGRRCEGGDDWLVDELGWGV